MKYIIRVYVANNAHPEYLTIPLTGEAMQTSKFINIGKIGIVNKNPFLFQR